MFWACCCHRWTRSPLIRRMVQESLARGSFVWRDLRRGIPALACGVAIVASGRSRQSMRLGRGWLPL